MKYICSLFFLISACIGAASAAPVTVDSYVYGVSPNSSYPDSSGQELTDGNISSISFADGIWTHSSQAGIYSGWLNRSLVGIGFNFSSDIDFGSLTIYFDDADGAAGVDAPGSVNLFSANTLGGFSDHGTFAIPEYAGTGATSFTLGMNGITSDYIELVLSSTSSWLMLSEVTFDDTPLNPVPLPASLGLLGSGILGLLSCRKQLNKA